jgi:hypothetical protein
LVAVPFVTADLPSWKPELPEPIQKLSDRVHRVFVTPCVDDPCVVAFAQPEDAFIVGSSEIAKGARLAVNDPPAGYR